ncbi:MAG: polysaccharide biosynthesis C-terminal domain-containing protein [Bradyrhizobium sp.]|nr:polysaccharide biosynthesis C-terminal domain-containing protein [Bradyrhizobium sp.]
MLIRQASINLIANVGSALLGLLSVSIFTRLFSAHDYGAYLLGTGLAAVSSVFLVGWFRNLILSGHARDDGADIRGVVLAGYAICGLAVPVAFRLGQLLGLDRPSALAVIALAVSIGLFELTQDLLRARLEALAVMRAMLVRAVALLALGVAIAFLHPTGPLLLTASAAAYLLAVLVQTRTAWGGVTVTFDLAKLIAAARSGLPLTLSLTLLAIASVTDRFVIASLVGTADAGQYVAALDLVRQTLMMPALSAAAAFFPLAMRIHAAQGNAAVSAHLADCAELLFAIILPGCLGFAIIAPHVANLVLGPDFRLLAAQVMPIVAFAVLFQIMTQQYLHASFLLSRRNSFYLINTATIITANATLSYLLVGHFGTVGAAWARLGADVIGFVCALLLSRLAFPIPVPVPRLALVTIAGLVMALLVAALDRGLRATDAIACLVLVSAGILACGAMYWLLDIARGRTRLKSGVALFRTKFVNPDIG